jgi:cell division protein FtsL
MKTLRFFLLLAIIASAIGTVTARRHEIRLLRQVQAEEKQALALAQEYRELLLERSLLGSYARIERIARDKLGMVVPVLNLPAGSSTSSAAKPAVAPATTPRDARVIASANIGGPAAGAGP